MQLRRRVAAHYNPTDRTTRNISLLEKSMIQTIEAVVDPEGRIRLLGEFHVASPRRALVTVLEEPPAGTIIFLLTDSSEHLLPTIRSRSQLFYCSSLHQFSEAG